ncbi:MAG TPA: alkaline phosphatase D family protein [Streptosporangiaceae bacterium]|nr:alkaline phosphatase D family protein [Streptosporangiaceae bacterium]
MTDGAPELKVGPLLRYVAETEATIWVETDRACQVAILGHQAQTFEVAGHHFALVVLDGLRPGQEYEYQVALDGTVRWPIPDSDFPPSTLRTTDPDRPVRLVFGSCRIDELPVPRHHGSPQRQRRRAEEDEKQHGPDAMVAYALDLKRASPDERPDLMLLIGDQVYADNPGPGLREHIDQTRGAEVAPGYEVANFAEYCFLYCEAWTEPSVRWLLSVVPTAMIFDDHDVHDDWNTSAAWRREYAAKPWWPERIRSAYMSYWIYQHIGNLSPAELAKNELWQQMQQPGDHAGVLGDFAEQADQGAHGIQWSYRRTFGGVRVVVIDSRGGRVVDGQRLMVDDAEWQWVVESAAGDWDHVVLASSLPLLLPDGIHEMEAWNEAVCAGAWGRRLARLGERVRQELDLEHWSAFGASFRRFEDLLTGLATGAHGNPPVSVIVIGGDIHHSYVAAVEFPAGTNPRSAVYQAVCSPMHNVLPEHYKRLHQLTTSRAGGVLGATLAKLAGAFQPRITWQITEGSWFHNMLSALEYDGRRARIRFARAVCDDASVPHLQSLCDTDLT